MSILKTKFGTTNKNDVYCYTIDNKNGLIAEILNYGCIIKSLKFNGVDVVLGRDTLEEYINNEGYFGAMIGRNANRIEDCSFEISGNKYSLYDNNNGCNLHGGMLGFDKKVWNVDDANENNSSITLSYISPDGEEGFPGTLKVKVTYEITLENSIKISYEAVSDKDTVANFTNHSYFNLNGHNSGTICNHKLWLNSMFYTPNKKSCVPNGEILSVNGTAFDFATPKILKESLDSNEEQIRMFGGIDHNFALLGNGFRHCGNLLGDKTGIKMDVYTDLPGVQIYTGNVIEEGRKCKEDSYYPVHGAICLETQKFPNNLKYEHFESAILKKNEIYNTVTEYKFSLN